MMKKPLCNFNKRYIYFGGLFADTKKKEYINPDKSRRPLTSKEIKAVIRAKQCSGYGKNANSKSSK